MNKPEKSNANSPAGGGQITAVALGLLHGLLWAGVLYGLVFVIPRYTAMFEDFDTQLPTMTLLVVYASRLAVQYWYLFVLAGLAALAIDVALLARLARAGGAGLALGAGALLALAPIVVGIALWYAVFAPLTQLIENLS
ncbi:MAG: hypothetical protein KDA41_07675 [Planctomycetales bacterium]|nr:hypothetical protein [Planctomycetales bacterium]